MLKSDTKTFTSPHLRKTSIQPFPEKNGNLYLNASFFYSKQRKFLAVSQKTMTVRKNITRVIKTFSDIDPSVILEVCLHTELRQYGEGSLLTGVV